jgi:hypothetical protein
MLDWIRSLFRRNPPPPPGTTDDATIAATDEGISMVPGASLGTGAIPPPAERQEPEPDRPD